MHWLDKVVEIVNAESNDLRELARLAGGDPKTFYRGVSNTRIDFSNQDVSGMQFTGVNEKLSLEENAKQLKEPWYLAKAFFNWPFSGVQARITKAEDMVSHLELSLKDAAAMNARLSQSELRYKGLVDAQGDAIFRRDSGSRLTYGNDAFFKLFGVDPAHAINRPFAPEAHPQSRAPLFGSFLDSGRSRARYDQHVKTAKGYRWIAWEDYAVRDARGRLVEVQSVGRDITDRKSLEDALTEARDNAEKMAASMRSSAATDGGELGGVTAIMKRKLTVLSESALNIEQRNQIDEILRLSSELESISAAMGAK